MATYMVKRDDNGCGFMGGLFHWKSIISRKSSPKSLLTNGTEKEEHVESISRAKSLPVKSSIVVSPRVTSTQKNHVIVKRLSDATRTSTTSSSNSSSGEKNKETHQQQYSSGEQNGIYRVGSGNILKLAQMGGVKKQESGNGNYMSSKYLPSSPTIKGIEGNNNVTMGNILRRHSEEIRLNKLDYCEELKLMGNEKYKEGKYEEALALYNKAICMDCNSAVYRSNKSAALTGLGRILEAVIECMEAVRIEPCYQRAHHRLANLYFRLGKPEAALQHLNLSGSLASFTEVTRAKSLQKCLSRCTEFRDRRDWTSLLEQTHNALAIGANSSLQIYALQGQALISLLRQDEAYEAIKRGPKFDMDSYAQLFGKIDGTFFCLIQAQVYMVVGRFEEAITAAQTASQLNPNDKDTKQMVIKTRAVSVSRSKGNKLFNELKFPEACSTYSEGLEYDPYNAVLLCNRAACRLKLGQFEKALEDCTLALTLQPSYRKARLRRAHCNAKMERWEASIRDYETLIREKPGDEEVGQALFEAQIQLKKQHGEDVKDLKFESHVVEVSSIEHFRHVITSPGMSVVLFCYKSNQEKAASLLQQVCPRFPSINFLKVEVEDQPYLAKSEAVNNIPSFKIYKNGSRIKDISGNNLHLLENSVKILCG